MSLNLCINRSLIATVRIPSNIPKCCYASRKSHILDDLKVEDTPLYDSEPIYDEDQVIQIRNISRLDPAHRNILNGQKPYDKSKAWFHETVWYKRRMLGRYGIEACDISPGIAWPTKEDVEDRKEYERVAYPLSLQQIWKDIEEKKKKEALQIKEREEEIDKVVANFDKWRKALDDKMEKKKAELLKAKKEKARMMREVRDEFGYNIDPRDERFQELMAQRALAEKKKKKEEKKKKKEEKFLAFLEKQDQESKVNESSTEKKIKSDSSEKNVNNNTKKED